MDNWLNQFEGFLTGASNPTDCVTSGQLAAETQAFQEGCQSNSNPGDPKTCCTWIANGTAGECKSQWVLEPYSAVLCDGSSVTCSSAGSHSCDDCFGPNSPCCTPLLCSAGPVGDCICSGDCQCGQLQQTGQTINVGPDCNPPGECDTVLRY